MKLLASFIFLLFIWFSGANDIEYPTKPHLNVVCDNSESKKYSRINEKYYFLGETKISWLEAVHTCRRFGGDLAQIASIEEMKAISQYLQHAGIEGNPAVWVSGYRQQQFISVTNGLPLKFTAWLPGQPEVPRSEECISLRFRNGSFRMNNDACSSRELYLCQKNENMHCQTI